METPADFSAGAPNLFWQRPTLPLTQSSSTIGAEGLNFRVRNGIGCIPLAKATRNLDALAICVAFPRQTPRPLLATYILSTSQSGLVVFLELLASHNRMLSVVKCRPVRPAWHALNKM